jgi:hypothetical protein
MRSSAKLWTNSRKLSVPWGKGKKRIKMVSGLTKILSLLTNVRHGSVTTAEKQVTSVRTAAVLRNRETGAGGPRVSNSDHKPKAS